MASKIKRNNASIYIKLPASMKEELEKAACKETMTVSLLVRKLIKEYLENSPK